MNGRYSLPLTNATFDKRLEAQTASTQFFVVLGLNIPITDEDRLFESPAIVPGVDLGHLLQLNPQLREFVKRGKASRLSGLSHSQATSQQSLLFNIKKSEP